MLNNKQILGAALVILVIALFLIFKKDVPEGPKPAVEPITGCYIFTLGKDVYILNIKAENDGMVSGELEFNNFEKDSSHGNFHGKYEQGILLADYEFDAEGMHSIRQVAFKKTGPDFVEGFGPAQVKNGREAFTDLAEVKYDPQYTFKKSADCQAPDPEPEMKAYGNTSYKLKFSYPETYYLKEKIDAGAMEGPEFAVTLVLDTPDNRALVDGTSAIAGEGPTSINVSVYKNPEKLPAKDWVTRDPNWAVTNSVVTRTSVAGIEGISFTWSGLYEGKTVIVTTGTMVYTFSVTWITPDDTIKKDFEKILSTVSFK